MTNDSDFAVEPSAADSEEKTLTDFVETRERSADSQENRNDAPSDSESSNVERAGGNLSRASLIHAQTRTRRFALSGLALSLVLFAAFGALKYGERRSARSENADASSSASSPPPAPIRSIAVMPLKNLSGDASKGFFSDGVTESLITQLAKTKDLRVISRSSSFAFKNREIDAREVSRQLGGGALLEGGVRQSENEVWVEVRLVNAADGQVLWSSDSRKRAPGDIFDIQDEISCGVANNLQLLLCGKDAAAARRTKNAEAYEAYLKGRYHWYKRTTEDMKQALAFFAEATQKDPNYAPAHLGLAETYGVMQINRQVPPNSVIAEMKRNAQKALQLDPTLARAYAIQALCACFVEWRWDEGERLFKQAVALDANDCYIHGWRGNALLAQGRFDEAEAELKQAQELDPLKESIADSLGEVYCYWRQAERCASRRTRFLRPSAKATIQTGCSHGRARCAAITKRV